MIDTAEFHGKIDKLRKALSEKLRVNGPTLERQVRRAGRRLPRRQRHAAASLLGAQDWMGHARLARLIDRRTVEAAFRDLHAYLERLDPAEARRTALLRLLGSIVFNLMLLGVAIYVIYNFIIAP